MPSKDERDEGMRQCRERWVRGVVGRYEAGVIHWSEVVEALSEEERWLHFGGGQ